MNVVSPIFIIPAYRVSDERGALVTFRCPFCNCQHVHGLPDGDGPVLSRVSHCLPSSPWAGREYHLVIAGEVREKQRLPKTTMEDLTRLRNLICGEVSNASR